MSQQMTGFKRKNKSIYTRTAIVGHYKRKRKMVTNPSKGSLLHGLIKKDVPTTKTIL